MVRLARSGRQGRLTRSGGAVGGGGGGGGGAEPLLVGFTSQNGVSSPSADQCTLPTGSAAGDLCLVFHGTNYGTTTPSFTGGTVAKWNDMGNPQGIIYSKVLDGTDISNGYVAVICPAARGAIITAAWTGGTFTETPDAVTTSEYVTSSGTVLTMPTPLTSNSLTVLMTSNTNGSGPRYTAAASGLTLVGQKYYGTSNDCSLMVYWAWNQTGSAFASQTLTFVGGPDTPAGAEFPVT